ncbi:hypothetical protein ACFE04_012831 [Oxalis oulophora]
MLRQRFPTFDPSSYGTWNYQFFLVCYPKGLQLFLVVSARFPSMSALATRLPVLEIGIKAIGGVGFIKKGDLVGCTKTGAVDASLAIKFYEPLALECRNKKAHEVVAGKRLRDLTPQCKEGIEAKRRNVKVQKVSANEIEVEDEVEAEVKEEAEAKVEKGTPLKLRRKFKRHIVVSKEKEVNPSLVDDVTLVSASLDVLVLVVPLVEVDSTL